MWFLPFILPIQSELLLVLVQFVPALDKNVFNIVGRISLDIEILEYDYYD